MSENKKQTTVSRNKLRSLFRGKDKYYPSSSQAERYKPDPYEGLTSEQVAKRVEDRFVNVEVEKTTKSITAIILSNVFTYFNLIFFILAFILLLEKSYNNLTFLFVVFVNTVIGIFQEIKAKKTLEKLTLVSAPLAKVIRDGKELCVNSRELVLDDIVIFEAGNQICADAILCDGEVNVNESLVTGESDEIKKGKGDELLSGSFVVSGRCRARLNRVGLESFASRLTADAKKIKKKQQPGMMKSLTLLIKIIGIIIIPFSIIMFINQYKILGLTTKESVENTAASVIGMIPEGLYLLTTVALAVSVMRLARKKTLVHDMKCIETLARVDVICVDKTGTVTEPNMHLKEIVPLDTDDPDEYRAIERILSDFVMNMNADNNTMEALKNHFGDNKGYRRASSVKGFSSATKYSAVEFDKKHAYVLGAPEFILRRDYEQFRGVIEKHSSLGERVLLLAEYEYEKGSSEDIFGDGTLRGIVIPIALVTLINRIRPEAKETFQYFTSQNVAIKVISGDNPITVSKAAEQAGIPGFERYIDASLLDTQEKVEKGILEYNVFGRVTPEQKRAFVRALKKAGHTVAMTGDGVNDVLALKDADCSIAMASGSDAAANVSDLVLLDSNFACMPSVVAEGRRVINNIERSAALFLVKNIFSFILTLITLFTVSLYPLKPAQISLVSALMIGIPSFCLALEPNRSIVKGRFLRNVMFRAFPAALAAVFVVGWSLLFRDAFAISQGQASTVAFYLYSFVAYLMLFRVCKPMNLLHKVLFGSMGVLFLTACTVIPSWFDLEALNYGSWLILVALICIAYPVDRGILYIFNNFGTWIQRLKDRLTREYDPAKTEK